MTLLLLLYTIAARFRDVEDVIPYEESKTTRDFTHFQSEMSFSRVIHNNFCRGRRPRRPAINDYRLTFPLYVILSEVELLPSEERGRSKARSAAGISFEISVACQWDVTSIQKPPKLVRRSLRRIRSSVLLVRFVQPAKLRLQKSLCDFLRSE